MIFTRVTSSLRCDATGSSCSVRAFLFPSWRRGVRLWLSAQAVLQRLESIRGGYGGDTSIALRMAYLKSTGGLLSAEFPLGKLVRLSLCLSYI